MATTQQGKSVLSTPVPTRRRFRKAYAWILVVALLGGALITRAVLNDGGGPATKQVTVRGWAYADGAVGNASLSIETAEGDTVVRSRPKATAAGGTFAVAADLPADYRVSMTGGTIGEQVFTGRLVADVVDYGPTSGLIQVNPITTLLAAYRDEHGGLSPAQAKAAVGRFLTIPSTVDITADLRGNEQWFSPEEFMRQASAAGGVQAFVTKLVAEIGATPAKTHPFVATAQNDVLPTPRELVAGIGKQLAGTALTKVLEAIGLTQPVDAETLKVIREVQVQLTQLQASIDQIMQRLTQASYDRWATELIPIKNAVINAFSKLEYAAVSGDKALAEHVTELVDALDSTGALRNLHSYLTGEASSTGAYRAYSTLIKSKSTFWGPAQTEQLLGYFDYYDTIQVQLIFLLRERALAQGTRQDLFNKTDLQTYDDQRKAQLAIRDAIQPATTPIDVRTELMWAADNSWPIKLHGDELDRYLPALNATGCVKMGFECKPIGPLYGFGDWRVPSDADLKALVAGQTTPKVWLRDQWANPRAFLACAPGGECAEVDSVFTSVAAKAKAEYITKNTNWAYWSGECVIDKKAPSGVHLIMKMDSGAIARLCDNVRDAYIYPVRALTPAEKYWL